MVEHVFLYRYRKRQSRLELGFVGGKRLTDHWGFGAGFGVYNQRDRSELLEGPHQYREVLQDFAFGGPSLEAFLRIIGHANAQQVPVFVVNMPFRKDLLRLSAHAPEDYASYLRQMTALSTRYGFTWLDYQDSLPLEDRDFFDVDHLNFEGAKRLSRRLAEDLTPQLRQLNASASSSGAAAERLGDRRPGALEQASPP
jgi:hypothetical protein